MHLVFTFFFFENLIYPLQFNYWGSNSLTVLLKFLYYKHLVIFVNRILLRVFIEQKYCEKTLALNENKLNFGL